MVTAPPGVMSVILPVGHVVEVLESKPAGMKWGLSVRDYNGAFRIVNMKEERVLALCAGFQIRLLAHTQSWLQGRPRTNERYS